MTGFHALPFAERYLKGAISAKFGVRSIPTLVEAAGWGASVAAARYSHHRPSCIFTCGQIIVDAQGNVLNADGRSVVAADPKGRRFPWRKE